MERARASWTTGASAQAAAAASVDLENFVVESRARMLDDRRRLVEQLRALGLTPSGTVASFCIVAVRDGAALRRQLLARHRILVRECASFGLPDHIRLAARPRPETDRLVAALAEEIR